MCSLMCVRLLVNTYMYIMFFLFLLLSYIYIYFFFSFYIIRFNVLLVFLSIIFKFIVSFCLFLCLNELDKPTLWRSFYLIVTFILLVTIDYSFECFYTLLVSIVMFYCFIFIYVFIYPFIY